jgi:cytochrome c553
MPAIDLGPHYSGGRYLAMFACGTCHGTELAGSADGRVPDLKVVRRYARSQFFGLMRKGRGAKGRRLKVMEPLAKQRFEILMDWEIDPLYAYLVARANAPTVDQIFGASR